jgi:hypothetical protein
MICDFCSSPNITRSYECQSFDVVTVVPKAGPFRETSVGSWAACDECAFLIDTEQWEKLIDRSIATLDFVPQSLEERGLLRDFLRKLHKGFRDSRIERRQDGTPPN